MRTLLICVSSVLMLSVLSAMAGEKHSVNPNMELEDSDIKGTSIQWMRMKPVDPGGLDRAGADGSNPVISLRQRGVPSQLQASPAPGKKDPSTFGFDDKASKSGDSNPPKLSEPFPTGVSVSAGAGKPDFTGLMKSQVDTATGNVERIVIPTDPPKTLENPRKADGSPLTQLDLFKLGQGKTDSIPLKGGSVLNSPSGGPVSG